MGSYRPEIKEKKRWDKASLFENEPYLFSVKFAPVLIERAT
jgi:hypothetical protein